MSLTSTVRTASARAVAIPDADGRGLRRKLERLYDPSGARWAHARINERAGRALSTARPKQPIDERDALLIAYADHLRGHEAPLRTLQAFLDDQLGGAIEGVHVLPFHPSTSDGGFAVSDHTTVEPTLGTWADVRALAASHRMMVDCVLNHVSASHPWFLGFLAGEARYAEHFIVSDPDDDWEQVTRPRSSSLFTRFARCGEPVEVWTTFSPDQVDLNYRSPAVLVDVVDMVLTAVENGASLIRLDAIGYTWKSPGTACLNLPEAHVIVSILRDVVDLVDPGVALVTETNVPHAQNIRYFGDGTDEAQLVYNFALPPLLLHAMHTADSSLLQAWASSLRAPSAQTTFFNFTASHDGIGVLPVADLLSQEEIDQLCARVIEHGGRVNYRRTGEGSRPYEINATYFDAVSHPDMPVDLAVDRFIVTQAIMLALAGVPGIYLSSLIGARTWHDGAARTHHNRENNRERFPRDRVERDLRDPWTRESKVFARYVELLTARRSHHAFHPGAGQEVLDLGPRAFGLRRRPLDGSSDVLAVHNLSGANVPVELPSGGRDLITGDARPARTTLRPYEVAWIEVRA